MIEYEAIIFSDDDFFASACSPRYDEALREGRIYLAQYAEEGDVEMRVYKKELIHTEERLCRQDV